MRGSITRAAAMGPSADSPPTTSHRPSARRVIVAPRASDACANWSAAAAANAFNGRSPDVVRALSSPVTPRIMKRRKRERCAMMGSGVGLFTRR